MNEGVSIARIWYEFVEDISATPANPKIWDVPYCCEVPVDDIRNRVFMSIKDALMFAACRLGYDIGIRNWGCLNKAGWCVNGGGDFQAEWETDFTMNGCFQVATPDEIKRWENGIQTLYHMTILVSIVARRGK